MLLILQVPCYAAEINLRVISQIESSGNHKAVGDGGRALGAFQLHKGVIQDYNLSHNTRFPHKIALSRHYSRKIASWYINKEIPRLLRHFGLKDTISNRLTAYNKGIRAVLMKSPSKNYIKKYFKIIGEIENGCVIIPSANVRLKRKGRI